jgi:hypothetical protein
VGHLDKWSQDSPNDAKNAAVCRPPSTVRQKKKPPSNVWREAIPKTDLSYKLMLRKVFEIG